MKRFRISVLQEKKINFINAGYAHAAVVDEEGKLYTWGAGENYALGHGNTKNVK